MPTQTELLLEFMDEWQSGHGIRVFTSGSTGQPKEIYLTKLHMERSARRSNKFFNITRNSHIHSAVSFEFIGGKMTIVRALMSGCRLSYSEPSLMPEIKEGEGKIDLLSVVGSQMHYILENLGKYQKVNKYLIGGSAIDGRLWDRIASAGLQAWESYGMTETASHIALRRIVGRSDSRPRFVPFPGIKLSIDQDDCLRIKDEETDIQTNDIVTLFNDRSFEIRGRRDDVIISGGIKVLPQELEDLLRERIIPLCQDFYITSIPDEVWTSRIVLAFVPRPGADIKTTKASIRHEIDAFPLDVLPKKKRPKDIIEVPCLTLTGNGKLIRTLKFS